MKIYAAALAAALLSTGALAQVAGQTQYYGRDGAPSGTSTTYGNSTQYYGRDGAPSGTATYSQSIYPADASQSALDRTTSQSSRDTQQLLQNNGTAGSRYPRW